MKKIQMVDLKGQYNKIKSQVNNSINEVLESSAFINGPLVKDFQLNLEKYLGVTNSMVEYPAFNRLVLGSNPR